MLRVRISIHIQQLLFRIRSQPEYVLRVMHHLNIAPRDQSAPYNGCVHRRISILPQKESPLRLLHLKLEVSHASLTCSEGLQLDSMCFGNLPQQLVLAHNNPKVGSQQGCKV